MKWVDNIEKFFVKVEAFFNNLDFIARLTRAFSHGMAAFNDSLLNRNPEAFKAYLEARQLAKKEENKAAE